jgi:integrase
MDQGPSAKNHGSEINFIGNRLEKNTVLLAKVRYVDLETYRNHLRRKPTKFGRMRKDATVNREMSCLHHLFGKAFEWEMVEQSPFERGKSLMLKENNERVRFLNDDEIQRLLETSIPHLRDIIICAINTGMRRGEILNLKWNQIRGGFIYLQKGVKTKERREIPINDELHILLKRTKAQQDTRGATVIKLDANNVIRVEGNPVECQNSASEYVFTYKGKRVKNIKKAFKTALKNAGITDFRYHGLRHYVCRPGHHEGRGSKRRSRFAWAQVHVHDPEVFSPIAGAQKKSG